MRPLGFENIRRRAIGVRGFAADRAYGFSNLPGRDPLGWTGPLDVLW
jgi:hypothetical protein